MSRVAINVDIDFCTARLVRSCRTCVPTASAKSRFYGFAGGCVVDPGEAAGRALPAGNTPAPESGAAEPAGEAWAGEVAGDVVGVCAAVGAGEFCVPACVFISSRRNALSAMLRCA